MMQDSLVCNTIDCQKEEYLWCLYAFEASQDNLKIFCRVKIAKFICKLSNILVKNQMDLSCPLVPLTMVRRSNTSF